MSDVVERDCLLDYVAEFLAATRHRERIELGKVLDGAIKKQRPEEVYAFYQGVLCRIRPVLRGPDHDRYSWCSLLICIAQLSWRCRDTATALAVIEEAWTCARWFPNQSWKARLTATLALREAMVRSTAKKFVSDHADLDRNRTRIQNAASTIESAPRQYEDLAVLRLRCGLGATSLWQIDDSIGWVTRSRNALQALRTSLTWYLDLEGWEINSVLDRLRGTMTDSAKDTIVEVMVQMLKHGSMAGEAFASSERALALDYLHSVRLDPRRRAGLLLDLAFAASDQRVRSGTLHQFAHLAHTGELDSVSVEARKGLVERYDKLADQAANVHHRNSAHYTAFFWQWEALRVRERLSTPHPEGSHSTDITNEAPNHVINTPSSIRFAKQAPLSSRLVSKHPGPAPGTREGTLRALRGINRALRTENPLAMASSLLHLARVGVEEWPIIADIADQIVLSVSRWHSRLCTSFRSEVLPASVASPRGRFRLSCLLLADAVAQEFQPDLRVQIQENLAGVEELLPALRVVHARNAVRWAHETGRWIQAAGATVGLLQALDDSADRAGVTEAVSDLCEGFLAEIAHSSSGVGLYELLKSGSENLAKIAEWLADHGYARESFLVVRVASGWLCQAMAKEPALVDDYEAIQRVKVNKHDNDREALFLRMEQRMFRDRTVQTLPKGVLTDVPLAPRRAFVQFLVAPQAVWALVAVPGTEGSEDAEFVAVQLSASRTELESLAQRIWAELRPARAIPGPDGRVRSTRSLQQLHALLITPLENHLVGMDEIVFTTDGVIARLPLHAAHGPEGFLIEHVRCRYSSHRWNDPATGITSRKSRTVFVGGWDPDIGGPEEARLVTGRLCQLGYLPEQVRNAQQGRIALLDASRSARLLHLVAHGELRSGPLASESKLQLSASVQVVAGDWMRAGCLPDFAFLNACGLGGAIPHSGDLSGFPLALRVRGVRGSLTAIADLPSHTAHRFADAFYRVLPEADTFEAYLSATRGMVAAGEHPAAWAPYVYEGESVTISSCIPTPTESRTGAREGRSRRRRKKVIQ
ncbi:CHAT domain-containing protein [Rhodococcus opacus]|uniref:CHAT domain-containing protein n=1 Tax=Rhodococcus opacus TaxID=37919 RepID=UPI001F56B4F8|nr:CHAT domain-containing protein [Rhodococcus opacus]UNN05217.1 CHAT domain-containing protein [Rhodococcus opacus]